MAKVSYAELISSAQVMSTGLSNNAAAAAQRGWSSKNNDQLMDKPSH